MNKYLLDAKLAHLTEDEVNLLLKRYYENEKIASLLNEFNIQCIPQTFAKLLPLLIHEDRKCPCCNSPMGLQMQSRTSQKSILNNMECIHCEHIELPQCRCSYCKKLKMTAAVNEQLKLNTLILEYCESFTYDLSKPSPQELSFRSAVALLALVRTCKLKNDGSYGAISNNTIPFAPKHDIYRELLALLIDNNLICPSATSPQDAFKFESGVITSLEISLLDWRLNSERPELLVSQIEDYGLNGNWPTCWSYEDIEGLRLELALAECKEFYEYCMSERSFHYIEGPAIQTLLLNLLRDFSVSHCCYFIWKGAQLASDYKVRNQVNPRHAANYVPGACLRWADRARTERWEIKGFDRNSKLPRSMLSYVLYDVMLKTGEKGFTEPLRCNMPI
ncbi:MAG: hypothetical protein V4445_09940 [Pseudomonadota bacterium]